MPDSVRTIATRLGVGVASVVRWRRGADKPAVAARASLQAAYGIPIPAWDHSPGASAPASTEMAGLSLDVTPAGSSTPLDDVMRLLVAIRAARTDAALAATERHKLIAAETRAIALRARLEQEAELLEDRIVKQHPTWLRMKRTIIKALVPYPDAARAVLNAMGDLGVDG